MFVLCVARVSGLSLPQVTTPILPSKNARLLGMARDVYDTRLQDLALMLQLCDEDDLVWEPFLNLKTLTSLYNIQHLGYNVHWPSVGDELNFYKIFTPPPDATVVVTNPPYDEKLKTLRHLMLYIGLPFILLLPSPTLQNTHWFTDLSKEFPTWRFEVFLFDERSRFLRSGVLQPTPAFHTMILLGAPLGSTPDRFAFSSRFSVIETVTIRLIDYDESVNNALAGNKRTRRR